MAPGLVAAELRAADGERYFASLFAPAAVRDSLMALHAFDTELARIRDAVREPALGEIRLQWWRDVIDGRRDEEAAGHPLATALRDAIKLHDLPPTAFARMIEARRFDLYDDAPPSRSDLEGYFGETSGAALQLGALVVSPGLATGLADAAGHGGCVVGIAELVKRVSLLRRRGRCVVPLDMLSELALDENRVLNETDAAVRAAAALIEHGIAHYRRFEAQSLPAPARPAFLPVASAALLLRRARAETRELVERAPGSTPLRSRWVILRAASGIWPRID